MRGKWRRLTVDVEILRQHRAALVGEDAGDDFGVVHDFEPATAYARIGSSGVLHEATDGGVEDGAGAQGAWFERADERANGGARR